MKNIKNIKLLLMIGLIVSCTPNVNNTLPSVNKSNSPSPKGSNSPNVIASTSPKPTDFPTITPSITVSTPSPNPINIKEIERFDRIKIYKDNTLMSEGYTTDLKQHFNLDYKAYNSVINEKNNFRAEIMYKDNTVGSENIVWSISENNNLAEVNQEGLLTNGNTEGTIKLRASFKYDLTKYAEFEIKILKTLEYKVLESKCDNIFSTRYIERFEDGFIARPSGDVGYCSDCIERTRIIGKVIDNSGNPVEGVSVNARAIDSGDNWVGETYITGKDGVYRFYGARVGSRVVITSTKDGWATRIKSDVLRSNEIECFYYDFKGTTALQDEPEIVSLKVNGRVITNSSNGDSFLVTENSPKHIKPTPEQLDTGAQITGVGNVPSLTGVNSNTLEVEMIFSEPVNIDDIRSNFRIISQSGFDNKTKNFIINSNTPDSQFDISADQKVVTFKTNKAILANKGGDEARYMIDFVQPFKDKTGKSAIDRRYFRFSNSQINDFSVFSLKNDETAPKLLGITAKDGVNGENDKIELKYSEPMELIDLASYPAVLSDPLEPTNLSRQVWYRDANNVKANTNPIPNNTLDNNATLFGFLNNSDTDTNQFRASYMIGRILASEISSTTTNTVKTSILGNKDRNANLVPIKANSSNTLIKSSKIQGNIVTLEFDNTAFDKDDRVIVSIANRITGNFVDRNRTPSINDELSVSTSGTSVEYASIYDPAGRLIDAGDSTTSANIDVHNSQRVTTAS
ncbi:MAG: carboxypeptidase-like regulatory domain-containing protein [Candidatus Sericytochromatia bacterium]